MLTSSLKRYLSLWSLGFWAYATCASVRITNGTVYGVVDSDNGVEKFLGLPYAEPPIGDRRLRQAEPLTESFGTFEADKFGSSCISVDDQGAQSEDCLTMNIWRPTAAGSGNESLPVLVWLYGGSLISGHTVSRFPSSKANTSFSTMIAYIYRPIRSTKEPLWYEFLPR